MVDKERKLWQEEEKALQSRITDLEGRLDYAAQVLDAREETDKLVQDHVQELVA